MADESKNTGMFVTHNLPLVRSIAQKVVVLADTPSITAASAGD